MRSYGNGIDPSEGCYFENLTLCGLVSNELILSSLLKQHLAVGLLFILLIRAGIESNTARRNFYVVYAPKASTITPPRLDATHAMVQALRYTYAAYAARPCKIYFCRVAKEEPKQSYKAQLFSVTPSVINPPRTFIQLQFPCDANKATPGFSQCLFLNTQFLH